jgi:hypothetical protein
MFVLNSICDDYENLAVSIAGPVTEDGARCGLVIERPEIVRALTELVEGGLAKAYRLHGDGRTDFAEEMERRPSLDEMEDPRGPWFYITEAGRNVHRAEYQGWPFDDEGELRKDWTPPEN